MIYFRLVGLIGVEGDSGSSGHFISYCFREDGWHVYDDTRSQSFRASHDPEVAIRALFFINTFMSFKK